MDDHGTPAEGPSEAASSAAQEGDARTGTTPGDELRPAPVVSSAILHHGRIWDLMSDEVELPGGHAVVREYVRHPGAVAVIALDDDERVLLLHQYRHPVRSFLWEPPAGLLDAEGEDLVDAAVRELAEEADLRAERWAVLADYYTSPGSSDEAIRIFLARGLASVPESDRHERQDEERDMAVLWIPLDDAVAAVLAGRIHNPSSVVGILAAVRARSQGWSTLRELDAPWVR